MRLPAAPTPVALPHGGCVGVVALGGQVVVEHLAGAAAGGGLRCAVTVRVTFVAGQPLKPSAGLAVPQQMAPQRAGALEAAGSVDALVGARLRKPLTFIYICPRHRERPAPRKGG